jgi:hypothetical protein
LVDSTIQQQSALIPSNTQLFVIEESSFETKQLLPQQQSKSASRASQSDSIIIRSRAMEK